MRLINADELIKKAYSEAEGMSNSCKDFGVMVEWLVDKMPSIELEQKKGVWMTNNGIGTICSNCYYKLETTGLPSKYSHCGAIMEGEKWIF